MRVLPAVAVAVAAMQARVAVAKPSLLCLLLL